jgi:hypothetical protein
MCWRSPGAGWAAGRGFVCRLPHERTGWPGAPVPQAAGVLPARAFREEHGEEMLAVMMVGAAKGQQRPRAREIVNVLRGAIGARLRPARPAEPNRALQEALALFSLIAPTFLAVVVALEALEQDLPWPPGNDR